MQPTAGNMRRMAEALGVTPQSLWLRWLGYDLPEPGLSGSPTRSASYATRSSTERPIAEQTQSVETGDRNRIEAQELTTSPTTSPIDGQHEHRFDGLDRVVVEGRQLGHWESP